MPTEPIFQARRVNVLDQEFEPIRERMDTHLVPVFL
jgi:hypothetical protein